MERLYVGVDLGGTNVRSGLADGEGRILARDQRLSLARESAEAPVTQIVDSIEAVIAAGGVPKRAIAAIGIGSPGPLSARTGTILRAGNLPHWVNFPLAAILHERIGIATRLQNDANLFALGEWWKGSGQGCDDFIAVTLGTGIGGGAIVDGKLLVGFNDNAMEIGHTSIDLHGPRCWCGQRGCAELYASATGIVRIARDALVNVHIETSLAGFRSHPQDLTSNDLFIAATAGDDFARGVFDEAGYCLGLVLVNALNILNFKRVAIGGGLAESGDLILGPARRGMMDRGFSSFVGEVDVVHAQIPDTAGILGAVKLVMDQ